MQKVTVRTDLVGDAQDSAWTQALLNLGMERTTANSLVPFRSVPQGRTELRHALSHPADGALRSIVTKYMRQRNILPHN